MVLSEKVVMIGLNVEHLLETKSVGTQNELHCYDGGYHDRAMLD